MQMILLADVNGFSYVYRWIVMQKVTALKLYNNSLAFPIPWGGIQVTDQKEEKIQIWKEKRA